MKLEVWVFLQDGCDGSVTPYFYCTEKEAEKAADIDFELCGQAVCENIACVILDTTKFKEVKE